MRDIQGFESVEFTRLHAAFEGFVVNPAIIDTQFMGEWRPLGGPIKDASTDGQGTVYSANDVSVLACSIPDSVTSGGITFNQAARVCHVDWLQVNHDNLLGPCVGDYYYQYDSGPCPTGPNGLPEVMWNNQVFPPADTCVLFTYTRITPGYSSVRWGCDTPSSMLINGCACVPCQGFQWRVKAGPATDASQLDGTSYASLRFRVVGSGGNSRWYAVAINYGYGVAFGYNDVSDETGHPVDTDPSTGKSLWVYVDKAKVGADFSQVMSGDWGGSGYAEEGFNALVVADVNDTINNIDPPEHTLTVKFVAGQLQLSWNADDISFIWPHEEYNVETGEPDWCIDEFQVACGNMYLMDWSVHLYKFALNSEYAAGVHAGYSVSNQIQLCNTPSFWQLSNLKFRIHTLPFVSLIKSPTPVPNTSPPVNQRRFNTEPSWFDADAPGLIPPGCSVGAVSCGIDGTFMLVGLWMDGPYDGSYLGNPYSNFTAFVNSVTTTFPAEVDSLAWTPTTLGNAGAPPEPEEISITMAFDINTLSYTSQCQLTWPNFHGEWTNSAGSGYIDTLGQFATQIRMGARGLLNNNTWQSSGNNIQFTGIANREYVNTWGGGGNDKLVMTCNDFWTQCDVPIWNLRFFDGMNVYFVIHELAQFCGIPDEQMFIKGFGGGVDIVPDNPYGPSPNLADADNLYLPVGPAGTPITRFAGGTTARQMMLKIGYALGMSCFFDVAGFLHFEPWLLSGGWSPGTKIFSAYAGYGGAFPNDPDMGILEGNDEVWSGQYKGGLVETRNAVMTEGPLIYGNAGQTLVGFADVPFSITDDGWENFQNPDGSLFHGWGQTGNVQYAEFLGYRDMTVWIDNIFADQAYADLGAQQMLAFLRLPDREISFTTWLNTSTPIYPGMMVLVWNPRSGSSGFWMFVTSVRINHRQGQPPTMTIAARIIPQEF